MQSNSEKEKWIQRVLNLLKEGTAENCPREEKGLLTKDKTFIIPDIAGEAAMFEWAGVSFGEDYTLQLSKSIKRLA